MDKNSTVSIKAGATLPLRLSSGAGGPIPDGAEGADLLADLILATGRGDDRAFRRLYDAASPILLGMLIRRLGRREMAEDVLQECFLRIWQRASTYDPSRGSAMAWLATVARNQGIDALRKQTPEECFDEMESVLAEQADADSDLEREADVALALRRLEAPLAALSPPVRASILLTCYAGHSHLEGAQILRAPLGTIKSWVRRGLEQLRVDLLTPADNTH